MSVRAYRVNKIESEDSQSFNLWHDDELVDFLQTESGFYNQLNEDGGGMVSIEVGVLKNAIKQLKLEDYAKKALKADIAFAKQNKSDFIEYICF